MTTTVTGLAELKRLAGRDLGHSAWHEIDQARVNTFADATGDHQWIHVDPERAAGGPFKGTIAHGYLTLSLIIPMWNEILEVNGISMGVNYGLNKVRFPSPVPVGARVRASATVVSAEDVPGGAVQAVIDFTVQREGADKPCCVAQAVYRYHG